MPRGDAENLALVQQQSICRASPGSGPQPAQLAHLHHPTDLHMSTLPRRAVATLPLLLLASACVGAEPREAEAEVDPTASAGAVQVIDVSGFDYGFEAPEVIDAGWTRFRFANRGPEAHHLTLMRLAPGRTASEALAALRDQQPLTGIATAVGGPNAPMPGASADATLDLEPGEYLLVCVVPSPDGTPHFLKGMAKPITVRATDAPMAAAPATDLEVTLTDYTFEMGESIAAGERSIRVVNASSASEPHEIVLVRLPDGATAEQVNEWMHSMEGPPPGEFIGGITALDPGESGAFTADFTPGEYAFLCPLPSPDGELHTNKGMMHQFRVM